MLKKGRIESGCYQFPVSFVLPTQIPGSFNLTKNSKTYARIRYTVTGKFLGGDGRWFKGEFNLTDEKEITVVRYYRSSPLKIKGKLSPPFMCCCRKDGLAILNAEWDKKVYHAEETAAKFTAKVNTKFLNSDISDLQGQLYQVVTVKCGGSTRSWTKVLSRCSKGSVKKGTEATFVMTPKMATKSTEMSTFGSLVKCDYYFVVSCKMNCLAVHLACANEPKMSFRILVCQSKAGYEGLRKENESPTHPADWNPESHRLKVIALRQKGYIPYTKYTKGMSPPFAFILGNVQRRRNNNINNKKMQNSNKKSNKDNKDAKKMLAPPQPSLPQIATKTKKSEKKEKKALNKINPKRAQEPETDYGVNCIQSSDKDPMQGNKTESNPFSDKLQEDNQKSTNPFEEKKPFIPLPKKFLEDETEDKKI